MQHMDVALFHPLKVAYRDAIRTWRMKNNGQFLNKVFFPTVLKNALGSLDIKKILKNGFKKCGLHPFSENAIDFSKLMTNNEDKIEQGQNVSKEVSTSATASTAFQEIINFIESNIDFGVLQQFKSATHNKKLAGSIEYSELYNFWMRCQKKVPEVSIDKVRSTSINENSVLQHDNSISEIADINNMTEMEIVEVDVESPVIENCFADVVADSITDNSTNSKNASATELDMECRVVQELIMLEDGTTTPIGITSIFIKSNCMSSNDYEDNCTVSEQFIINEDEKNSKTEEVKHVNSILVDAVPIDEKKVLSKVSDMSPNKGCDEIRSILRIQLRILVSVIHRSLKYLWTYH